MMNETNKPSFSRDELIAKLNIMKKETNNFVQLIKEDYFQEILLESKHRLDNIKTEVDDVELAFLDDVAQNNTRISTLVDRLERDCKSIQDDKNAITDNVKETMNSLQIGYDDYVKTMNILCKYFTVSAKQSAIEDKTLVDHYYQSCGNVSEDCECKDNLIECGLSSILSKKDSYIRAQEAVK